MRHAPHVEDRHALQEDADQRHGINASSQTTQNYTKDHHLMPMPFLQHAFSYIPFDPNNMRSLLLAGSAALFSSSLVSSADPDYYRDAGVLQYVNPKIGTSGVEPNDNGGMIPSVSPPFGMTRWTPQVCHSNILRPLDTCCDFRY